MSGRQRFRPGPSGYWTQAWFSTVNAALHAVTLGRKLFLEGRRSGRGWRNWTRGERTPIDADAFPDTEAAIVDRILSQPKLRCIGSGHSFNAGVRGQALLSLDKYTGFIDDFDHSHLPDEPDVTYVRVRAGTRVRDVNRALLKRGLAIAALPSHDAQSVAGILSTDVHGTGRDIGFVSHSVMALRVTDGRGKVHDVGRDDVLFRAAIGGIGAVGVITQASLRCVPAFNIRQTSEVMSVADARSQLDALLGTHDHLSFYVFPFATDLQVHTWDRTDAPVSKRAAWREFKAITIAALGAAWIGDAIAWRKKLSAKADKLVNIAQHTDLVMTSAAGFNRSIYHMHQELEFAMPFAQTWSAIDKLNEIYETLYCDQRLPYTLLEVRFTPANGTQSLISPGAGDQACVWITLGCNQSKGFVEYFDAVEQWLLETNAKPHLGKWCERYDHRSMAELHGESFAAFQQLMRDHDPAGRFRNDFVNRMFGPLEATP